MLDPSVVDQARVLLAQGHSQRAIARLLPISRSSVGLIAAGRRPDYPAISAARRLAASAPSGPPRRCPTCRAKVLMPCVRCRTLAVRTEPIFVSQEPSEPPQIELRDAERARYEQVRAGLESELNRRERIAPSLRRKVLQMLGEGTRRVDVAARLDVSIDVVRAVIDGRTWIRHGWNKRSNRVLARAS